MAEKRRIGPRIGQKLGDPPSQREPVTLTVQPIHSANRVRLNFSKPVKDLDLGVAHALEIAGQILCAAKQVEERSGPADWVQGELEAPAGGSPAGGAPRSDTT